MTRPNSDVPALRATEAVEDREALEADPGWEASGGAWMVDVLERLGATLVPRPLEQVAQLRRIPYRSGYLFSEAWRRTRESAILAAGHQCQKCGARGPGVTLDVHHLTYERLGDELAADLIVLCRGCHQQEHYEGAD